MKKITIVLFLFFLTILLSCSAFESKSTWTFKHGAYGKGSITVTPKGDADKDSFTFYPGDEVSVTWTGDGEHYYNYNYKCASGVYPKHFDATRVILFTY